MPFKGYTYQCDLCQKTFEQKDERREFCSLVSRNPDHYEGTNLTKIYLCDVCKNIREWRDINIHIQIHPCNRFIRTNPEEE